MHDLDDETIRKFLGEAVLDQFKVIREYLSLVPEIHQRLIRVEGHLESVESTLEVMSALFRENEKEHREFRKDILQLQAKAA